jgi:hypothetical protein
VARNEDEQREKARIRMAVCDHTPALIHIHTYILAARRRQAIKDAGCVSEEAAACTKAAHARYRAKYVHFLDQSTHALTTTLQKARVLGLPAASEATRVRLAQPFLMQTNLYILQNLHWQARRAGAPRAPCTKQVTRGCCLGRPTRQG